MPALDQLIVALDFPSRAEALACVDRLQGTVRWFKVGLELFIAEGPAIVEEFRQRGYQVFLDLKLHDIPNTVAGAVRSAAGMGAGLLTVHAAGGPRMIQAAIEAATATADGPRILAVTLLTSMDTDQLRATGVPANTGDHVVTLGEMAAKAGASGLVCSAQEILALRSSAAAHLTLVVPGIRSAAHTVDDQRRVATATEAVRDGANMLVVGRPITQARDPAGAATALLKEIASAVLA